MVKVVMALKHQLNKDVNIIMMQQCPSIGESIIDYYYPFPKVTFVGWIIDGNIGKYLGIDESFLESADVVVLLD